MLIGEARPRRERFGIPFTVCLIATGWAGASSAAGVETKGGWPVAPNAASKGAFAVLQATTADPKAFVAEWDRPTIGVQLKGARRGHRGQTLTTFMAFRGCRADRAGNCRVTMTYEVEEPSGRLVDRRRLSVWPNKPHPTPGTIQLAHDQLDLTFKPTDPAGAYIVRAAVTDQVAHVTLHTSQRLEVSP